jgi:hypothetical protein
MDFCGSEAGDLFVADGARQIKPAFNLGEEYGGLYTERLAEIHQRSDRRTSPSSLQHVDIDGIVA